MKFSQKQKSKKVQYVIGSIVAIIVLFLWISMPLMNSSSLDSSVPAGGFSKKSADLSLLDGAGADAPGSPLSGELIDNPATTLDLAASALFNSGVSDEGEISDTSSQIQSGGGSITVPGADAPVPSSYSGPKGKLQVLPSLTSGNSGSQTIGSTHNKFFGSNQPKAELVPQNTNLDVKPKSEKAQVLFAALKNAEEKSLKAAESKDLNESRNTATTAFESGKKNENLSGKDEQSWADAAGELGKIDNALKQNDPSLNKHKITPPAPKKEIDKDKTEEEMKKWLLQMILQATVGQMFGAMGQMMAAAIYPNYMPGSTGTGGK